MIASVMFLKGAGRKEPDSLVAAISHDPIQLMSPFQYGRIAPRKFLRSTMLLCKTQLLFVECQARRSKPVSRRGWSLWRCSAPVGG